MRVRETRCSESAQHSEMQPLSLLLCGLLLSCSSSSSDPNMGFTVTQTPPTLSVVEGESITITCCWSKNITRVKVKWYKDDQQTGVNGTANHLQTEIKSNCSELFIRSTSTNDTGYYICEVIQDIPTLVQVKGMRTSVEIQPKNNSALDIRSTTQSPVTAQTQLPVTVASVLASVSGALFLICLCVALTVRRTCKKTERVVIREGPPSEGDEPEISEEDDSSRNSRGSTQWYMVPVYESYFDLQRDDEEPSSKEEQPAKEDPSAKDPSATDLSAADPSEKEEEITKQQSVKRQSVKRLSLKRLSLKSFKRGASGKKPNADDQ